MDLSKLSVSVPDLSRFGPQTQTPLLAVTVQPGDRVMVLLPDRATQNDVAQVTQLLKQWSPQTEFLVLSGPQSITVIPGAPTEDKAPQGLLVEGLCGDKTDHDPHSVSDSSLGSFWCHADQSRRQPHAAEQARKIHQTDV